MPRCKFFPVFLFSVIALCPAFAQDPGSDDEFYESGGAGGLVVTASRTPEPAAGVPGLLTVISAADIAASGAGSITEILEQVPGVRFSGALSGAGSESVSMRGFGENSHGRVLVLVDGNKVNDPDMKAANWNAIPLAAVERIEIMDGGGSVQYGNNATGGVINIITEKSGGRRTSIGVSGGSFLFHRESFSHFEPFSRGSVSFSAGYTGQEGYRERQVSRAANAAAGAELFLRDNLDLSLNVSFADLYFQLPGGLTKEQFEDDPTKALGYGGTLNHGDENAERHFSGGIGLEWSPSENTVFNLPLSYRGKFTRMDMASYFSNPYTDRTVHSIEARPQGTLNMYPAGMHLRFLAGVDFYYADLGADSYRLANYTDKTNSYSISEWTAGPYVSARFSLFPNLAFTAGARFDTAAISAAKDGGPGGIDIDGDESFRAFVYEGGIVFNPLDGLKLYAKYSSLFRYPFMDELAQVSGYSDKFNSGLRPEKGFNAEAGTSYTLGGILDINAGFFFMKLEDEIGVAYLDPGNPYDATNVNLNETRRLGVNAGLRFSPVRFLAFDVSYSFVDAVFAAGANSGNRIPLVPAHNVYGKITVKVPAGFEFGPDFEYTSAFYYGEDYANRGDTREALFLPGAWARYAFTKDNREFSLQVSAKNLLDKRYASYGSYSYGSYYFYPADGRAVNVSLGYKF